MFFILEHLCIDARVGFFAALRSAGWGLGVFVLTRAGRTAEVVMR